MPVLPRRFLPPVTALSAFESAARLGSFTAAADELKLTQSAVSRQIRGLEQLLGADLFIRERQTVRLTVAGDAYAHEIRRALQQIATATLGFRANPQGGTVNLAILPTFGARWLVPRLRRFLSAHPGVSINLSTRLAPFDFDIDHVDAAIHFGTPDWPGAKVEFLMSEWVLPACSRELKETYKLSKPADLLGAPLVHLVTRPDAWERWLRATGVKFDEIHGMLVDQFSVATQTAIAGVAVALLPSFLIEAELTSGELLRAVDRPMQSPGNYYIAWPASKDNYAPLQAFRTWIRNEAQAVPRVQSRARTR